MPVKKRRLSPSAASSASSTPAPTQTIPPPSGLSSQLESTSLSAFSSGGAAGETVGLGLAGPGPSTLEQQTQEKPFGRGHVNASVERREHARLGSLIVGSGDGGDEGEECFLWTDIPVVKNFRYAPCTLSPTPSPHPLVPFHRTIPYPPPIPPVRLSWLDRSSFLRVSPSALTISNDRGFRSARANVAVREGSWYFEVRIEKGHGASGGGKGHLGGGDVGNAHVRIGWGRREASIDAPVGADGYSYGIRDVGGEKVTLSRPKPYANKDFKTGDVIGCMITLPSRRDPFEEPRNDPKYIKRQRRHFNYKGQSYFESPEYTTSREMDAMVDREGKQAAAAAAATAAAVTATEGIQENGNGTGDMPNGNGGGGPGKKGATTKNTKKGKKDHSSNTAALDIVPVARVPPKLEGSSVVFYLNGESLGEAFTDLYDFTPLPPVRLNTGHDRPGKKAHAHDDQRSNQPGEDDANVVHDDGTLGYYPMISCFGKGKARFNPGPDFEYPPSVYLQTRRIQPDQDDGVKVEMGDDATNQRSRIRAMCERWDEFREEELRYDERDEAEDTEKLKKILEDEEKQKQRRGYGSGDGKGAKKKAKASIKRKKLEVEEDGETMSASTPRGETMTPAPEPADSELGLEDSMSICRRGTTMTPAPDEEEQEHEEYHIEEIKVEDREVREDDPGHTTDGTEVALGSSVTADTVSSPMSLMNKYSQGEEEAIKESGEGTGIPAEDVIEVAPSNNLIAAEEVGGHDVKTEEDGQEGVSW
ncbi:hypothetical protein IAU59_006251 [Kwoniella sp. CBS 9459]